MEVESRDIVIAAVDAEPVCKRLVKECGQIVLKLESTKYPSRYMMEGEDAGMGRGDVLRVLSLKSLSRRSP